jgi:hypothetical protein
MNGRDYYLSRRPALLARFDGLAKHLISALREHGVPGPDRIVTDTRSLYSDLIPGLPYIGGDDNRLTENLLSSMWALPLYRVLRPLGLSAEETGAIVYETVDSGTGDQTPEAWAKVADYRFSEEWKARVSNGAAQSKKCEYEFDWVYDYIAPDAENDYGIDYTECGLEKFMKAQGASELTPYLCKMDFIVYGAMDAGLRRTTTVADGAARCDFRFKRGRKD